MAAQKSPPLHHVYIDGFAGAGVHKSKSTGEFVPGSPLNALLIVPPFREYHLIDLDSRKASALETLSHDDLEVRVYEGDCNQILLDKVFPLARYEDYRRALCILDPYGLHLDWRVIAAAGAMRSIELFVNFPVIDINRNVLWHRPEGVSPEQESRLTRFWGDESWKAAAYRPSSQASLFGGRADRKVTNDELAATFRQRLKKVAGFAHVPKPIAMRNSQNAIVYYLYFAAHKPVANNIVESIFRKHRERGGN